MGKFKDRTDEVIGRLTVIRRAPDFISSSGQRRTMWECKCECGSIITVRSDCLNENHTISCGCYHSEMVSEYMSKSAHKTIHNDSRERLHNIWYLMHYRCNNHKFHEYHNYGGRGIHVCEEWTGVDGYFRFKEWALKNGYDKHLTIDRINVDGNYEPQNCRWITKAKQNTNKRTNVLVEFDGEVKSLAEWSEAYNIPYKTLHRRLKLGWSIENAITRPIRVANHIKQNDG